MYRNVLKPLLFLLPPEKAHTFTLAIFQFLLSLPLIGRLIRNYFKEEDSKLERSYLGLKFKNPIGLAAGFDKDGSHHQTLAALGFGFVEVGTVTPRGQAGNPQPRLFRLAKDEALINRMGFNNLGVEALVENLKGQRPEGLIVGGIIGKNKDTPNEKADRDYMYCFEKLFPWVDYFVVNVSSPNTPNLRALQEKKPLTELLLRLQAHNQKQSNPKPILLKIAPDLSFSQLDDIVEIVKLTRIAGVIATNTTISREQLSEKASAIEQMGPGGLSGKPLEQRSNEIISYLHQSSGGSLFIIGVGGVNSPQAAIAKLKAGASLVQIYTGLIYEGPTLVKRIKKNLIKQT